MALIPLTKRAGNWHSNFEHPRHPSPPHFFTTFSPSMDLCNAAQHVARIPELLIHIFNHLSLGQLLRLRCISKYWHDVLIIDIYPKKLPYFNVFYTSMPRPPDLHICYDQAIAEHMPGWNGAPGNEATGCRLVSFPVVGDDTEPPYLDLPPSIPKSQFRHFNAMRFSHASWLDMQVTWPPSRKIRVYTPQPDDWSELQHTRSTGGSFAVYFDRRFFFKEVVNNQGVTMKQLARTLWAAVAFRLSRFPYNVYFSQAHEAGLAGPLVSTYGMFQIRHWIVEAPRNVGEEEAWWKEKRRMIDALDEVENGLIDWWREEEWWKTGCRREATLSEQEGEWADGW